jgi:hypothetical protein
MASRALCGFQNKVRKSSGGGKVIAEREDNRDGTVLIELSYGWLELKELERMAACE